MNDKLDNALRHALTPGDEADIRLNQKILNQAEEKRKMAERKNWRLTAAIAGGLVLCISSVTVYAAWKYLPASDVAANVQEIGRAHV